jgi:hypothetical protein
MQGSRAKRTGVVDSLVKTGIISGMKTAPTWDVTYKGMPLTHSAYTAHLVILQAYRARQIPAFQNTDGLAIHEATVAIHTGGISRCVGCAAGGPTFHWCQYRLSTYGEIYAAQRGC